MKRNYVTVKEAALKLGMKKGEIKSLIRNNFIDYKLENGTYVVDVRSIKRIVYKPIPMEVIYWVGDMKLFNLPSVHKIIQKEINGVEYTESVEIKRIGKCEYEVTRFNRFWNMFTYVINFGDDWKVNGDKMKYRIHLTPKKHISIKEYGKMFNINGETFINPKMMKFEMVMKKHLITKEDFERFKSTLKLPF